MAGETKVGLLAGLAFIICFAVILANRGQTQRHVTNTVTTPVLEPANLHRGVPSRIRYRTPA